MAGYSMFPALEIGPAFSPLKAVQDVQDFQTNQELAPYKLQDTEDVYNLRKADYGNNMLQQAATEALNADPDQAPGIWDTEMQKLASQGVPGASQFIGRYRPDIATRLQSAFAGAQGGKTQSVAAANAPNPQALQAAVAQMPVDQLQSSLGKMNMAINSFNRVTNQDQWNQEVQALKNAGIPVDKFIDPSADWRAQYAQAYKAVQDMVPYRDAVQQRVAAQSLGLNIQPPVSPKEATPGATVYDTNTGKILFQAPTAPTKDAWEFLDATKTGGIPLVHNKDTNEFIDPATNTVVTPPAGAAAAAGTGTPIPSPQSQAAYNTLTAKVMQSENASGAPGLKSPTSNAAGPGQFMPATWINTVKQNVPGMKNASDQEVLALRTDPRFPGLARDMTNIALQDGAAGLQKAGLPVTTATAALAYKLGLPNAMKVINAKDDNTPMTSILSPLEAKENPQWAKMNTGQMRASMQSQFGNDPLSAPGAQGQGTADQEKAKSAFGQGAADENANDPESSDILAHTGMTLPTWFVLTGQASKLARGAERTKALKDADTWLKKNKGMDLSTFQEEYQANNNTLGYNIARYNQTGVMENEMLATLANLDPVAMKALAGRLTPVNAALVFAGKQTNDPVVNQYMVMLKSLKSETAGWLAALQGRGTGAKGGGGGSNTVLKEFDDEAASFLADGINSGGLSGIRNGVIQQTDKMQNVMENSIDMARHSIWNLFGVGNQFKERYPESDARVEAIRTAARAAAANAPGSAAPIKINSPDDVKRLKLKPGTPVLLPDGRVGTVPGG